MRHAFAKRARLAIFVIVVPAIVMSIALARSPVALAGSAPIATGDLAISGESCDCVDEYTPSGTFVQTLMDASNGLALPTGSAFDGAGNLYVTDFSGNQILRRDAVTGAVTVLSNNTILGDAAHPYDSPESIAFSSDFSKMYISDANRFGINGGIHIVSTTTGAEVGFLPIPTSSGSEGQGESDWLAFNASNNLFMTNENPAQGVMQVNLTTGDIVVPSFVAGFPNFGYALSFDKNGNVWVGDTNSILEFDTSGAPVRTITNPAFSSVFAAVFNPAGDTFYAGDLGNGNVYTYDLTGTLAGTFNPALGGITGLSVAGAKLANQQDTTPPSCTLKAVVAGPPKQIIIATQDSDGGLASITVTASTNATVSVPAFTAGTTSEVDVTATKIDQTQGSSVALEVKDLAGNTTDCDPAVLNVNRQTGKPASMTVHGIAKGEHLVHIYNGTPGVSTLSIDVNGKHFQVSGLRAGQQVTIDIGSALAAGSNSVALTASGAPAINSGQSVASVVAIVGDH